VIKEQKAKKAIEEAKVQERSLQGEVNKVGTLNDEKKMDDSIKKSPHTAALSASETAQAKGGQQQGTSAKQRDGMKPVSTTAIPGTPWCVVWTDKNRVFYFNPSTKTSVWDRPAELRNREDVDKMVSNPINPNASHQTDDDCRNSVSSDQTSAQAEKRIKLDSNSSVSSTVNQNASSKPAIAPKIVKKEVASEVEKEAAKKRETISFEERVETFRRMLEEKEVNPTSTFQKELSKIVFDPRYLLLTSNERREVFEKYCLEKAEEDRKKRRERIKIATDDFKALLNEANLTSRSVYDEFHAQHSKDPRYKALEKTKDREILFDDHLAMLRRKERDERSQHKRSERRSAVRGVPREEAENIFQALLTELITDPEFTWHDAKRVMRRSHQWSLTEDLPRDWKEMVFEKHVGKIYQRRKEKFHQLLSETREINLAAEWRDIRRIIRDDPRYIKFSSSDRRCEREYRDFIKRKRVVAEENFRQLLRETKLIGKDTRRKIEESEHQHLIDIIGTLQNDKRYVELEPFSEERRKILLSYIEELAATSSEIPAQATPTTNIGIKEDAAAAAIQPAELTKEEEDNQASGSIETSSLSYNNNTNENSNDFTGVHLEMGKKPVESTVTRNESATVTPASR